MKNLTEQEKKQQAIDELKKILLDHAKKAVKLGKYYEYYKPKKHSTLIKRFFRMYRFAIELRSLLFQIQLVKSQPIFPVGGVHFERGEEMIVSKNGSLTPLVIKNNDVIIPSEETIKIINKKL